MKEMLSVIVPVYNVQDYLAQCIESIINQTYELLEIILVDDGSTDLSADICDMFAKKDKRIKVIHKENGGSICARYVGVLQAKSKYITFVDSDDWIMPDMYENLMSILIERNIDMVASGYIIYWNDQEWKESKDDTILPGEYNREMIEEKVIPKMMWCEGCKNWPVSSAVWNKIFKRDILLKIYNSLKDYKFHFADDAAVVYPYILEAQNIYFTHECYYFYRQRKRGEIASYIKNDYFFEDLFTFFKYLKEIFENYKNKDVLIKQLEYFYMISIERRKQKYHDTKQNGFIGFLYLFPFERVNKNSRIIIYGAGKVGHEYYDQVKQLQYAEIVLWVDKNYYVYKNENINSIDKILDIEYDYLVIANASKNIIQSIIKELIALGVPRSKIID